MKFSFQLFRMPYLAILSFILFSFGCMQSKTSNNLESEQGLEDIRNILDQQSTCWNKGDLDCFMNGYWESDSLKFIGKSGLTYGWQKTLDNYKRNYSSVEQMGTLKFDILEMDLINENTCFVIGKYHLTRSVGDLEGHFSLVWKRIAGEWVIVADHSS